MHIGNRIHSVLVEKGMTVSQFADAVPCTRENAYKILRKANVDTGLLRSICQILDYDFFKNLGEGVYPKQTRVYSGYTFLVK